MEDVGQADRAVLRRPIGEGGRLLKEALEASQKLFKETGCYQGVDDLAIKRTDPIRYEKIWSRLRGALVGARETALNISASPIVREIGELCFALYTPEGDSITLSTGIIAHVHTMSDTIKYMVSSDYETNPGISLATSLSTTIPGWATCTMPMSWRFCRSSGKASSSAGRPA